MKAIKCSQCGAIIEEISSELEFTKCSYCGATYRLKDVKIIEISRKEAKRINTQISKSDIPFFRDGEYDRKNNADKSALIVVSVILFLVFGGMWVNGLMSGSFLFGFDLPEIKITATAKTTLNANNLNLNSIDTLNFDHVEFPKFYSWDLPTWNTSEFVKTAFVERRINVKVKVDKSGKVTEAKAQNGHQYIQRISEKAALNSTFYPPVNSDVTIVYLFSVRE